MQSEAKNGTSHTRPILLRIESKAGHGAGKPVTKQIEEFTDVYSFLFWQLGVKRKPGRKNRQRKRRKEKRSGIRTHPLGRIVRENLKVIFIKN